MLLHSSCNETSIYVFAPSTVTDQATILGYQDISGGRKSEPPIAVYTNDLDMGPSQETSVIANPADALGLGLVLWENTLRMIVITLSIILGMW